MWLDFGHADYSIPLGLLYGVEARAFGLSETAMRWPMLVVRPRDPRPVPALRRAAARSRDRGRVRAPARDLAAARHLQPDGATVRDHAVPRLERARGVPSLRCGATRPARGRRGLRGGRRARPRGFTRSSRLSSSHRSSGAGIDLPARPAEAAWHAPPETRRARPRRPAYRWRRCSCRRCSRTPNRWR